MNETVSYQVEDGVALVALSNGKVNAISPDVIAGLLDALERSEQDGTVVILTGAPGIFSAGFDLKVMRSGPEAAIKLVSDGFKLLRRMLVHPTPIIIANPGHAMAMGAIVLLAGDFRLGTEGPFSIALNEVQIGMTMPYAGIELARNLLTHAAHQRAINNAEVFSPQAAKEAGFLDQIVAADALLPTAKALAERMKTLNMAAHKATKLRVRQHLLETLDKAIAQDLICGI